MSARRSTCLGRHALAVVVMALGAPCATLALEPTEVFARVAPSIWRVQTFDEDGLALGQGSAVVIAPDSLVTNCHVLSHARQVSVRQGARKLAAQLALWDPERDLCQLRAPDLGAPAVVLGDVQGLQVGQPVFAVGNPQGLDQTMSAGLLSALRRNEQAQVVLLQTSAPISGGSSGGGLFDAQGALIGLTTLRSTAEAQNLNFAIPVDWIRELPRRHAARALPATPPPPPPPPPPPRVAVAPVAPCTGAEHRPPPPSPADPAVADLSRLPLAKPSLHEGYRRFLNCPFPRAFAISELGHYGYAWSTTPRDKSAPRDPAERALRNCERISGRPCFLYAVDDRLLSWPTPR